MAGPTISRRLTLNSRCRTDSGTFVSEWMSRRPAVAAATRPAVRLLKMRPITGAAARQPRLAAAPTIKVTQNTVSSASAKSRWRCTRPARSPPSTKLVNSVVSTVPAVNMPTSVGVSRRARAIVCTKDTDWPKSWASADALATRPTKPDNGP